MAGHTQVSFWRTRPFWASLTVYLEFDPRVDPFWLPTAASRRLVRAKAHHSIWPPTTSLLRYRFAARSLPFLNHCCAISAASSRYPCCLPASSPQFQASILADSRAPTTLGVDALLMRLSIYSGMHLPP